MAEKRVARPVLPAPFEFNRLMMSVQDLLTEQVTATKKIVEKPTISKDRLLSIFLAETQEKEVAATHAAENAVGAAKDKAEAELKKIRRLLDRDKQKLSVYGEEFFNDIQDKKQKLQQAQEKTKQARIDEYSVKPELLKSLGYVSFSFSVTEDKKFKVNINIDGKDYPVSTFSQVPYIGGTSRSSRKPDYKANDFDGVKCRREFSNLNDFIEFATCASDKDSHEYHTFRSTKYAGIVRYFAYITKMIIEGKADKLGDLVETQKAK